MLKIFKKNYLFESKIWNINYYCIRIQKQKYSHGQMDDVFCRLKQMGKNNVDNLTKWLQDSKVIDKTKEQEEKFRKYFEDVADKNNIPVDKFKEVVAQVASETKKNLDGVKQQLAEYGPQVMSDVKEGAAVAATTIKAAVDETVKDLSCKKK